jgi:hypothetical protein
MAKFYHNGLREGARVEIVGDHYGQADKRISLIGLTGTIRAHTSALVGGKWTRSLCWDVELDAPLRDGRKFLWCSTWELREQASAS